MGTRPRLFTPAFVLLWTMTFITFFAAFMLFPTVPLRLRELGASLAESGRFLTVFTAGSAFGALFTGPFGDRIGQRRMMVICALGFALFSGAYGWLPERLWFYVLAPFHGLVWSGLLTATMSTLGDVLPTDQRTHGMSLYGLASPLGAIFGPLTGLALQRHFPFHLLGTSILCCFLLLTVLAFSLSGGNTEREHRPYFCLPERRMLAPCVVLFATALGYGALGPYTAQEAKQLAFPAWGGIPTASAFLSFMGVGMVGMRIVMTRLGFGTRPIRLLPLMLMVSVIGLTLLAVMPGGLVRHLLSGLAYGAGYSMIHTLVSAHVLDTVHSERRGAAFGATLFSFDAGIGLGSFVIGLLIERFDYRVGWAVAALVVLAALRPTMRLANSGKTS